MRLHRCRGRNPFIVDRSVPYGYLYVIYETTLHLMNTPSDIFANAYKYIMIVSGGILAQMLYNCYPF